MISSAALSTCEGVVVIGWEGLDVFEVWGMEGLVTLLVREEKERGGCERVLVEALERRVGGIVVIL